MTKDELIIKMKSAIDEHEGDPEAVHSRLDDLLLEYIGDAEVKELFRSTTLWYA